MRTIQLYGRFVDDHLLAERPGIQDGLAQHRADLRKPVDSSATSIRDSATALLPMCTDVKYGPCARNVLDLRLANSPNPTPVVAFIHGGEIRAAVLSDNELTREAAAGESRVTVTA